MFEMEEAHIEAHESSGSHTQSKSFESLTRSLSFSKPSAPVPSKRPYLVGLAGGTASGKTSLSKLIVKALANKSILLIALDSFYR